MAYRHSQNTYKHQKRERKFRLFVFMFVVLLIIVSLGVIVDIALGRLSNNDTVVTNEIFSSVQSANVSVFRTEYFQFQATDDWQQVANLQNDNKYVFTKSDGPLITERLIVYVDRPAFDREADMPFTHVLPVSIVAGNKLEKVNDVSNHCSQYWPEGLTSANARISVEDVEMFCHKSSKQFNVVVGEFDGNEVLQFESDSAYEVTLTMVYSNLTAYPGVGDLYNIIPTFETL